MKFFIKDEDGKQYEVEEVVEETNTVEDEETLSVEDISALKKLASVADKLVALATTTDSDADEDIDNENDDDDLRDSDDDDDNDEKVVTTDSKSKDAKRSVGAIEKKSKIADSSLNENYEIEQAWAKRFNGGKEV